MTSFMHRYIRAVDAANYRVGRVAMYGIFVIMGILLISPVHKVINFNYAQFHKRNGWPLKKPQKYSGPKSPQKAN